MGDIIRAARRFLKQDERQIYHAMLAGGIPNVLDLGTRYDAATMARGDAAPVDAFFVARELNSIMKRTFDVPYLEFKGRSLVDADRSLPLGMTTFSFKSYAMSGEARRGGDRANDIPLAEATAKEFTGRVEPIRTGYEYSLTEIQAAQSLNLPLEQRKANSARHAFESSLEQLIATGDSRFDMYGLLNQPSALPYSIPNGASGSPLWSSKTAQEILADINGLVKLIISTTNNVEKPDTLLLDIGNYTLISELPWNSANATNITLLKFILENHPWIKRIEPWYFCAGAGSDSTNRMCAYKKSPDKVFIHIPEEFTQYPVQIKGFVFQVPAQGQTSGVISPYPYSIGYADGI